MSKRNLMLATALAALTLGLAAEAEASGRRHDHHFRSGRVSTGIAVGTLIGEALVTAADNRVRVVRDPNAELDEPIIAPRRRPIARERACIPLGPRWYTQGAGQFVTVRWTRCADGRVVSEQIDDRSGRTIGRAVFSGREAARAAARQPRG